MNILSVDSLSKAYGDKTLFDGLSFGMMEGEKVAIIGKNGSGKSTLLKIIAGLDTADSGKAVVRSSAKLMYLPQEPAIDPNLTPIDYVLSGRPDIMNDLAEYKFASDIMAIRATGNDTSGISKDDITALIVDITDFFENINPKNKENNDSNTDESISTDDTAFFSYYDSGIIRDITSLLKDISLSNTNNDILADDIYNKFNNIVKKYNKFIQSNTNITLLTINNLLYIFINIIIILLIIISKQKNYHKNIIIESYISILINNIKENINNKGNYTRSISLINDFIVKFIGQNTLNTAYQDSYEAFKNQYDYTIAYLNNNKDYQEGAEGYRNGAEGYRNGEEGHRNGAEDYRNDIKTYRNNNNNSRNNDYDHRNDVDDSLNDVDTYLNNADAIQKALHALNNDLISYTNYNFKDLNDIIDNLIVNDSIGLDEIEDILSSPISNIYDIDKETLKTFADKYMMLNQEEISSKISTITDKIEAANGWDIRQKAEKYLDKLGVKLPNTPVKTFSGGEKKRVAIARALIAEPTLLLLDEPTNHLDVDTVQWLQDVISGFGMSILLITHDRYFLDSVATRILELDEGVATSFPGNYEAYLTKKDELQRVEAATLDAKQKKLKTELEWLRRGAKARRTKAKSRIDDIHILKEETVRRREEEMDIRPGATYLGGTILEAHNLTKNFGGKTLIDKFNYVAKPIDRVGIIGKNGSGKSTLLNLLAEELKPDSGYVTTGQTAKVGFFRQEVRGIDMERTVIDNVKVIADHFKYGYKHEERVTAEDLLERFMFSRKMQRQKAGLLSGGELKRLALLRVLIANPNVLFMDEPTNDFDLQTLAAMEDYLDLYQGVLITISHDRAFLDRAVDTIWSFEKGIIKEYPGNYSAYLEKKENQKTDETLEKAIETKKTARATIQEPQETKNTPQRTEKKKKLSYKEQREYDGLMELIEEKSAEREEVRRGLAEGDPTDYEMYQKLAERLESLGDEIDELEMRWLELSEIAEGGL